MSTPSCCAPARTRRLTEFADNASIPVINGLTVRSHPCQIMADVMTFEERKGPIKGRTIAWIGDANNVATSWVHAAARFGFTLRIATPAEFAPAPELLAWAWTEGADVEVSEDGADAVRGADCVVTDVWVSMGDNDEKKRKALLRPFQVDEALMGAAKTDAIFMHCLPAHRGDEVSADGHRRPPIGRVGRGGEPAPCAEGHSRLVSRYRHARSSEGEARQGRQSGRRQTRGATAQGREEGGQDSCRQDCSGAKTLGSKTRTRAKDCAEAKR